MFSSEIPSIFAHSPLCQESAILNEIASWSSSPKRRHRIRRNTSGKFILPTESRLSRFITYFLFPFSQQKRSANDLTHLPAFFDSLREKIEKTNLDDSEREKIKREVDTAFASLTKIYMQLREENHAAADVKMDDIREAIAIAISPSGLNHLIESRVERISSPPLYRNRNKQTKANIPLVNYTRISDVAKHLKEEGHSLDNIDYVSLKRLLQDDLDLERVPSEKILTFLYRHRFFHQHRLNALLTSTADKLYNRENVSAYKVAHFFRKLHIDIEQELSQDGKIWEMSALFTQENMKGFRSFQTLNEAFLRKPSPLFNERLFDPARRAELEMQEACGLVDTVICTAFSRMRWHPIEKGSVYTPFHIMGKLLSNPAQHSKEMEHNLEEIEKEKSYEGDFLFTLSEALGQSGRVPPDDKLETSTEADKKILDETIRWIDGEKTHMFIQRLAPTDIHWFSFPTPSGGRFMTRAEICDYLQARQEGSSELFNRLRTIYDETNNTSSTIDVNGTLRSVNPIALKKEPEILAQNYRRIGFCRHKDDSVSLHIFIGATGVGQVSIEGKNQEIGTFQGSMAFGKPEARSAEEAGHFALGGSTVISLYLDKDYRPLHPIEEFSAITKYGQSTSSRLKKVKNIFLRNFRKKGIRVRSPHTLEMRMRMGQEIAKPLRYLIWEKVQGNETDALIGDLSRSDRECAEEIFLLYQRQKRGEVQLDPIEKEMVCLAEKVAKDPFLTPGEQELLNKMEATVRYRRLRHLFQMTPQESRGDLFGWIAYLLSSGQLRPETKNLLAGIKEAHHLGQPPTNQEESLLKELHIFFQSEQGSLEGLHSG